MSTTIGLASGKQLEVDGSIEQVRATLDNAGGKWAAFTAGTTQLQISSAAVVYLASAPSAGT